MSHQREWPYLLHNIPHSRHGQSIWWPTLDQQHLSLGSKTIKPKLSIWKFLIFNQWTIKSLFIFHLLFGDLNLKGTQSHVQPEHWSGCQVLRPVSFLDSMVDLVAVDPDFAVIGPDPIGPNPGAVSRISSWESQSQLQAPILSGLRSKVWWPWTVSCSAVNIFFSGLPEILRLTAAGQVDLWSNRHHCCFLGRIFFLLGKCPLWSLPRWIFWSVSGDPMLKHTNISAKGG